jgi:hypothetical protein
MQKSSIVPVMQPMSNVQLRAQVPQEVDTLAKAIAPFKNTGKDWTVGDVVTEALIHWFNEPVNRQIVDDHNLLKLLKDRGLPTDFLD